MHLVLCALGDTIPVDDHRLVPQRLCSLAKSWCFWDSWAGRARRLEWPSMGKCPRMVATDTRDERCARTLLSKDW
jgi:hypothetical protein